MKKDWIPDNPFAVLSENEYSEIMDRFNELVPDNDDRVKISQLFLRQGWSMCKVMILTAFQQYKKSKTRWAK